MLVAQTTHLRCGSNPSSTALKLQVCRDLPKLCCSCRDASPWPSPLPPEIRLQCPGPGNRCCPPAQQEVLLTGCSPCPGLPDLSCLDSLSGGCLPTLPPYGLLTSLPQLPMRTWDAGALRSHPSVPCGAESPTHEGPQNHLPQRAPINSEIAEILARRQYRTMETKTSMLLTSWKADGAFVLRSVS
ncbi:hypothetical protein P7K49_027914 [Saguinus oedipus]|uniref:SH2 domain-containing protein n=1 Tax=Saguinus oedipus TaxID=9490 RepID=A0ABQ9UBA5_SAGOE|nr:hypothetical protein P7K49_027914 [Saguinus oedipus]